MPVDPLRRSSLSQEISQDSVATDKRAAFPEMAHQLSRVSTSEAAATDPHLAKKQMEQIVKDFKATPDAIDGIDKAVEKADGLQAAFERKLDGRAHASSDLDQFPMQPESASVQKTASRSL